MARIAQFKTNAARKAAAKRALKAYADGKSDRYQIIRTAEQFGWTDPGYTETLQKTVGRAVGYLAKIAGVEVRANPKFKTGPGASTLTRRSHGGMVQQKKKPKYVVGQAGRHAGVTRNPTKGRNMRKAIRLYTDFTGHDPKFVDDWELNVPDTALQVGLVTGILYKTRMDGKVQEFMHEFTGKSRPILAASADGQQLLLLGGDYKFTERGIVDGTYSFRR